MKIAKDTVVSFDYTLTDTAGKVLDTSNGGEPLSYLQGAGNIIPGRGAGMNRPRSPPSAVRISSGRLADFSKVAVCGSSMIIGMARS